MTRPRPFAQYRAVLPFLFVAFVLASAAPRPVAAQNFPPSCAPQGNAICAGFIPTNKWYKHRSTCRGFPNRSTEAEAIQDITTDYTREGQCSLSVAPRGGWLSGGPHSIGHCGGLQNFISLPFRDRATGIPIENYRYYDINWQEPYPLCGNYRADTTIMERTELACPTGLVPANYGTIVLDGAAYTSAYCTSAAVAPAKNLGKPGEKNCGIQTSHPIHIASGNKFLAETDYAAAGQGGLRFERFYNHGGVTESQSLAWGTPWSTNIGKRWRHTYDRSILHIDSGAITTASAYRADGKVIAFNLYNGAYVSQRDVDERLEKTAAGWKLTTSNDEIENYDAEGKLLSIVARGGLAQTLTYADGALASVTDSFGHVLRFRYGAGSRLAELTDPAGGAFTYVYDTAGNLVSVTYPDSKTRTYVYNESANTSNVSQPSALTGIIDENGARFATYRYDTAGRAIYSGLANGANATALSFGAGTSTVTDALGQARTYRYSPIQGVNKITAVSSACRNCGLPAAQSYDANGNPSTRTDFNGSVTNYSFDLVRNLQTSRTEAAGSPRARTISTSWHPAFRIPSAITEANRTTAFTHDGAGNVLTRSITDTSVTPNVSRTWTYTYDAFGRVLTEDGPRTDVNDVTTYTYNVCTTGARCGQLNSITNALGHVTSFDAYNAHGQPTQITDANGLVVTYAFDSRQRMTDRCVGSYLPACSGGELTHLEYWPTGQLRKAVNADGSYNEFTYDDAHRLTGIRDGANNRVAYTLDAMGNRVLENTYDPNLVLKRTHARVFNTLNQLWKEVNAAGTANVTTIFGYDSEGNPTSIAAPLGRNGTSAWDELGRLLQVTDAASGTTRFVFDANDNLSSITDPRGLVTNYSFTGFGDLSALTSPDTGTSSNTYDAAGNLVTSTDARSTVATHTYDALGRTTSAAYRLGSATDQALSFVYDTGPNGKGRLTRASDAQHSLTWSYDALGRVTGKSQSIVSGSVLLSMSYGYNARGQLATLRLPSGRTIRVGFDANGKVSSMALMGTPNLMILNKVTYDPFGPVTGWTWGNGVMMTRTYDADGKLSGIGSSSTVVGSRMLGYDDAFRVTSAVDSATGGPGWTLGYDPLDRLNTATRTGLTIGYSYDANGNRLEQTGSNASTYQVSATSNRLSATSGALARTFGYDASGNVLTTGVTTHTYYNNGRMRTARLGAAGETTYLYNALGQRVRKSGGAVATPVYFMYDESGHLVGEYNWSNGALVVIQETVWLGDIPVATLRPKGGATQIFHVHTDQLNAPRKVTTNAATPVLKWKWDPSPFGEGNPTAPNGSFSYNLRFPGQYFDVESNLSYNYFRDYDPALGRYVQSDPIGLAAGVNTYGYVKGMPVSHIDTFGLQTSGPCPMGQRSRPLPGAVNGYQCFDDPDAENDPPYCPTGACAVYPREPPALVPTCYQECDRFTEKCRKLVNFYPSATRISVGLVTRAGTLVISATGNIGTLTLGAGIGSGPGVFETLTGGMNEATLQTGCDSGREKCKRRCDCTKPQ